jgi:2-polyprenyl-3-methyl-5-hydroxy-6-metoxy-1,4-benzoquinol methylase
MERIYITKDDLQQIEKNLMLLRHIERYGLIRQFLYGTVLDCACGVGYGTYLCSQNPDVEMMIGIDIDKGAIDWAKKSFGSDKIIFEKCAIEDFYNPNIDILVSLETIEHLNDPGILVGLADRCNVKEILISFPTKKTTHYNKFHYYDLTRQDILDLFENFAETQIFDQANEFLILHLIRQKKKSTPKKRYKP